MVLSIQSRRRQWHLTPVLLPEKSHGRRSLVGCSPWGLEASDTTEQLHFHFSLSCSGEGNGSPPQCSCLENPRDGGAWWAAFYGVAQSQTRLMQLSSSSSSIQSCSYLYNFRTFSPRLKETPSFKLHTHSSQAQSNAQFLPRWVFWEWENIMDSLPLSRLGIPKSHIDTY